MQPMFKIRFLERFQTELLLYIESIFNSNEKNLVDLLKEENGEAIDKFTSAITALLNCFKYHIGLDLSKSGKKCIKLMCEIINSYNKIDLSSIEGLTFKVSKSHQANTNQSSSYI